MDDSYFDEDMFDIQTITNDYTVELLSIWRHMFNSETVKLHMDRLKDRMRDIFKDFIKESLEHQQQLQERIPQLVNELENLCGKLNVSIELPSRDLSLFEIEQQLNDNLVSVRATLREKQNELKMLKEQQAILCVELNEVAMIMPLDPLPSECEVSKFRLNLEHLQREREVRCVKLANLRHEIENYMHALGLTSGNPIEERLLHSSNVLLNEHTFKTLELARERYAKKVQERREQIDDMRVRLHGLWNRLGTSPETRNRFNKFTEYTQRTYDALDMEVKRCEALKSQNIKHYVEELRQEIRDLWEKNYMSELQRKQFVKFNSTCYTDDLIELHEMELHDLKNFYDDNRRILELYGKRTELWQRMLALDVTDPTRYNNRGGLLLKEEKERKMLSAKLPKIEDEIKQLVKEYEQHTHKPFQIFGENILTVMARDWQRKRPSRALPQSARSGASTYRTTRTALSPWNAQSAKKPAAITVSSNYSLMTVVKSRQESSASSSLTRTRKLCSSTVDCRLYCSSVVATPVQSRVGTLRTPANGGTTTSRLKSSGENLKCNTSRLHWSRRP